MNSSYLWCFCKVLNLSKNMMGGGTGTNNLELKKFSEWLLRIGDGIVGDCTDGETKVEISSDILIKHCKNTFDELIDFVYSHMLPNLRNSNYLKERTILGPTLEIIQHVNNYLMSF